MFRVNVVMKSNVSAAPGGDPLGGVLLRVLDRSYSLATRGRDHDQQKGTRLWLFTGDGDRSVGRARGRMRYLDLTGAALIRCFPFLTYTKQADGEYLKLSRANPFGRVASILPRTHRRYFVAMIVG
jgi:hypothetical protein